MDALTQAARWPMIHNRGYFLVLLVCIMKRD